VFLLASCIVHVLNKLLVHWLLLKRRKTPATVQHVVVDEVDIAFWKIDSLERISEIVRVPMNKELV